jgi:tetratricopeptide (TPR) repeat protein
LALGLMNPQKEPKELKYSFQKFPEIGLIFGIVLIVVAVSFLGLYFFAARFYVADVSYLKAFKVSVAPIQTNSETVQEKNLESAVRLNPYQVQYKIDTSQFYLAQALNELAKSYQEQDAAKLQEIRSKIQDKIVKAINLAKAVTESSPNNVASWENRGLFYREVTNNNLVEGAADWAIKDFQKASSLEPTNPVFYTEIGKLLMATKLEDAKSEFTKALELKSDYSDAVLHQSVILEGQGKADEAIKLLEDYLNTIGAKKLYDTDALFELGKLYYNTQRVDDAAVIFNYIILLSPKHSNAHYALGVYLASKGENDLALAEFKKVLELNPGNQDVIDKINSLEK